MKKKLLLIMGIVLAIMVVIGAIVLNIKQTSVQDNIPETIENISEFTSNQFVTVTENGVVNLYDEETGRREDSFDLKSLVDFTEDVINDFAIISPSPTIIPTPEVKVVPTSTKNNSNTYKGFEKFPVYIESGDYAWKIQKGLTPTRNIAKMLGFVKEVNGRSSLNPIFPGEKIIFLKEYNDSKDAIVTPTPLITEPAVETSQVLQIEPTPQIIKETEKIKLDDNAIFQYFKAENKIYAYNNKTKSFYKIEVNVDKINASVILTNSTLPELKSFIIESNNIYALSEEGNKVYKTNISNKVIEKEFNLENVVNVWTVNENNIYYGYSNMLGKLDMINENKLEIDVGDESKDIFYEKDNLFVLNSFGKGLNKSVLMKINPENLRVATLTELSDKDAIIISKSSSDNMYVGQIDLMIDLEKNEIKTPLVFPVSFDDLEIGNAIKGIDFTSESMGELNNIYVLKDSKITIYSINGSVIKEIPVDGTQFNLIK